jgi:MFS family permease
MSFHQTSVYVGTVGGSALAGWLGQVYGWRTPFLLLAGAGMLLGLMLAAFIREPRRNQAEREELTRLGTDPTEHEAEPPRMPMSVFLGEWIRTPTAVALAAAFFGANFVALVFLTWMPTFLNEKFHLDVAKAGIGATVFIQFASLVGAALGGALADRWRRGHAGGRIYVQALGTLLGAPFIFACGYTRDLWTLVGAMTAFGLCKGLYDANIWASLYDVVPVSRRGAAVGLMNMIAWIGGGLGSILIGIAADHGLTMSAAISSTAGIYVVVALALFIGAAIFAPRDVARQAY